MHRVKYATLANVMRSVLVLCTLGLGLVCVCDGDWSGGDELVAFGFGSLNALTMSTHTQPQTNPYACTHTQPHPCKETTTMAVTPSVERNGKMALSCGASETETFSNHRARVGWPGVSACAVCAWVWLVAHECWCDGEISNGYSLVVSLSIASIDSLAHTGTQPLLKRRTDAIREVINVYV